MTSKKIKRTTPTGDELSTAISNVLDQAVNAESPNAPKQMHLILAKENPYWKLPQRRVAKYMKRILKSRKDPNANNIVADVDEMSVLTLTSTRSRSRSRGGFFKRFRLSSKTVVESKSVESVPQDVPVNLLPKREEDIEVVQEEATNDTKLTESTNPIDAYENEEEEEVKKKVLVCEGCVMM